MTETKFYRTSDFQEAVFLKVSGIIFIRTEWPSSSRAVFIFRQPPDKILSEWGQGKDASVRVVMDAADFFRTELRGGGR